MKQRTNEQWQAELAAGGETRAQAVADLRRILVKGLGRGLAGQIDAVGADFAALMEDFAQDALLKILDNTESFEGRSRFTTWAHKIAVNVALSELRRKRWRDSSLDNMLESEDGEYTPYYVADEAPGPEATSAQADMLGRVQQMIRDELTDKQRTVMVAIAVRGITPAEVADELRMKPNAVYKVLHDARSRLKSRLQLEGLSVDDVLSVFV